MAENLVKIELPHDLALDLQRTCEVWMQTLTETRLLVKTHSHAAAAMSRELEHITKIKAEVDAALARYKPIQ